MGTDAKEIKMKKADRFILLFAGGMLLFFFLEVVFGNSANFVSKNLDLIFILGWLGMCIVGVMTGD